MQPGAFAFALLFAVESISRASIVSVVPIQAYDLIQDEQRVSIFYFVVGTFGMCATLCAPIAFQRFPRRYVYTGGALLLVAAVRILRDAHAGGTGGRASSCVSSRASTLAITLNLYIMEYIPKQGLVHSESLRLTLGTFAWTLRAEHRRLALCPLRLRRAVSSGAPPGR